MLCRTSDTSKSYGIRYAICVTFEFCKRIYNNAKVEIDVMDLTEGRLLKLDFHLPKKIVLFASMKAL